MNTLLRRNKQGKVEVLRLRIEALKAVAVTHPDIKSAFADAADQAAAAVLKRAGFGVAYVQKAKGLVS